MYRRTELRAWNEIKCLANLACDSLLCNRTYMGDFDSTAISSNHENMRLVSGNTLHAHLIMSAAHVVYRNSQGHDVEESRTLGPQHPSLNSAVHLFHLLCLFCLLHLFQDPTAIMSPDGR